MRLLLLNHNLRGRGTWHRAWHLGRELARLGHQVVIWTVAPHHYYRAARERRDGVEIVETPSWSPIAGADDGWGPLDVVWRLARVCVEPFDVCYAFAHPPNVAWPAWMSATWRRRLLLADWCDWYEGGIFPKRLAMRRDGLVGHREARWQARAERWEVGLERRMIRRAGRLTVISRLLRDLALEAGRRPEDVLLLPNGSDIEGITPQDASTCRMALGLAPGGPLLGYVANYHPDQELLLQAFARAAARLPDLKLLKTGPPFARGLIDELKLEDRILDRGFVPADQIPLILGASDALALPLEDHPSNRARVPYKFQDYLAAGRPIVTCRVGDLADWFGEAGEPAGIGIAAPPNADALGRAMVRIFDAVTDRQAMGAAARRLAETQCSWAQQARRLDAWLTEWVRSNEI